jgi:hypothetical protein
VLFKAATLVNMRLNFEGMKSEILSNLDNPAQLEWLYRQDKPGFKRAFEGLYPGLNDNTLISFWNERLNFRGEEAPPAGRKQLLLVLVACILAGVAAKLPAFFGIAEEFYYTRNSGFILFPLLTAYYAWKNKMSATRIAMITGIIVIAMVFINALPAVGSSDSTILACVHLLLFLWCILGFAFVGNDRGQDGKWLGFLRFNGDLVVITTLILIAGGIITGITIGLFNLIGFHIEKFYFEYLVIFSLPAAPIIGTYLTDSNPQLVGRVSPVIARIFSPVVLVMLVIYLAAIIY